MKDEERSAREPDDTPVEGLGDAQGRRVGSPMPRSGHTGAGSEAAEGIHSVSDGRSVTDPSGLEGKQTGRGANTQDDESGSDGV
jgi:hypothetical protein